MLDNDTRGWVMSVVSGIACTFGASIICVDLIIRQFPGKKNFKIEDSNAFLSAGLSLSFGVMIFSSLFSMLPSAKKYLIEGGMIPRNAVLTMIGCFLIGALGIFVVSDFLHRYIPHTTVGCDHEHGDEEEGKVDDEETAHSHEPMQECRDAPLMDGQHDHDGHRSYGTNSENQDFKLSRRPSLHKSISTKVSQLVTGQKKEHCDDNGQCYGYSDTCGIECFKNIQHARPLRLHSSKSNQHLNLTRPAAANRHQTTQGPHAHDRQPLTLEDVDETTPLVPTRSGPPTMENPTASLPATDDIRPHSLAQKHSITSLSSTSTPPSHASHASHPQHHHHVPTNVFLSIGLQTSTAIALHKIPEGFITYATNHANPTLGLSVFLALFIHNITEGFAMALPLYLAINSRWRAMFWSALLGGVSQPLGAGFAALWFKVANKSHGGGEEGLDGPGETVYGCMFAVTAGIMAMVSLQLLGESLDLTHSRKLCFVSAFAGMGILGLSSALTA